MEMIVKILAPSNRDLHFIVFSSLQIELWKYSLSSIVNDESFPVLNELLCSKVRFICLGGAK